MTKQQILLQTVVQIAIRIFHAFALILMAAVVFPLNGLFFPAAAVGAALLTGFFFPLRDERENLPVRRFDSPPLKKQEPAADPSLLALRSEAPKGLYRSGTNDSFNAAIHFLDADPAAAKRLRTPPPANDLPAFERFLAPLHPPLRLLEEFRCFARNCSGPLSIAFKKCAETFRPSPEEAPDWQKFISLYNRFLVAIRPFSQFFAAYDRAVAENSSVVDQNSQILRYALNRLDPSIASSDKVAQDPAELLKQIFDAMPDVHQTEYELPGTLKPGTVKKSWGFTLEIKEPVPELAKMLARKELIFAKAPPILRLQVKRFSQYRSNGFLTRIGLGLRKIDVPVQVPHELEIRLKDGTAQKYRLACCIAHEGRSFKDGRFIAGRVVNGQKYLVDDHKVIPADPQIWEGRVLPQAYLLGYLPAVAQQEPPGRSSSSCPA